MMSLETIAMVNSTRSCFVFKQAFSKAASTNVVVQTPSVYHVFKKTYTGGHHWLTSFNEEVELRKYLIKNIAEYASGVN